MAQTAIQFVGKDNVLNAYRARGIQAWSIWQGKDLNFSGCDETTLASYLDMLRGSGGAYQLRVHNNIEDVDDIDNSTPFQGSFRFRMDGVPGGNNVAVGSSTAQAGGGVMGKVYEHFERKMSEKMDRLLSKLDEEDDDKPKSLTDIAMGYLEKPEQCAQIIGVIAGLFGRSAVPAVQMAGSYNQVAGPGPALMTEEQEYKRLSDCYDILKGYDPFILDHLEKLATIAGKNTVMFKMLLTSLDNMK